MSAYALAFRRQWSCGPWAKGWTWTNVIRPFARPSAQRAPLGTMTACWRGRAMGGHADRIGRAGQFHWAGVVDVAEPPPLQPDDWLGMDLGIVDLVADSDGQRDFGSPVNGHSKRHAAVRQRLQQMHQIGQTSPQETPS